MVNMSMPGGSFDWGFDGEGGDGGEKGQVKGGEGEDGEDKAEEDGASDQRKDVKGSSFSQQRNISTVSPSPTTEENAAEALVCLRRSSRAASKTSHPPPTVTPTKVGSVSKQVGGRRKENFVNHFCFNRKESIKAIEHFNKFGFVKLDPNPSFKAHTRLLVQRLVDEALKLDKTLDEMLRLHVDEKMSSALGDRLRMMKHETTYPTRHRHKEFFDIMRELNLYFIAGNESALRMLTSNLQQRDESLHVFHERTEVLDIITLPGAKNQNEHLDAFFEKVK